jgi:hypothetical protein
LYMHIVDIMYICTVAITIFVASNLKKKALPFIRIYTYFFYLNDKPYWVS